MCVSECVWCYHFYGGLCLAVVVEDLLPVPEVDTDLEEKQRERERERENLN